MVWVIISFVNARTRSLRTECSRLLPEGYLVPVLVCGNEMTVRRKKERSKIGLYRWTTLWVQWRKGNRENADYMG